MAKFAVGDYVVVFGTNYGRVVNLNFDRFMQRYYYDIILEGDTSPSTAHEGFLEPDILKMLASR
jgi:hypothetical protein